MQMLFYGFFFMILAIFSDSAFVLLSEKINGLIRKSVAFQRYQKYIIGNIYLLLGLVTLFSQSGAQSVSK